MRKVSDKGKSPSTKYHCYLTN